MSFRHIQWENETSSYFIFKLKNKKKSCILFFYLSPLLSCLFLWRQVTILHHNPPLRHPSFHLTTSPISWNKTLFLEFTKGGYTSGGGVDATDYLRSIGKKMICLPTNDVLQRKHNLTTSLIVSHLMATVVDEIMMEALGLVCGFLELGLTVDLMMNVGIEVSYGEWLGEREETEREREREIERERERDEDIQFLLLLLLLILLLLGLIAYEFSNLKFVYKYGWWTIILKVGPSLKSKIIYLKLENSYGNGQKRVRWHEKSQSSISLPESMLRDQE